MGIGRQSGLRKIRTFSDQYYTSSFNITEDAYLRGGNYASNNYGSETDLRVKTGSVENYFRKTLLKMDSF